MKYVIDIDGTICTQSNPDYENAKPFYDRISKLNELYDEGHTIVYLTARGMGRTGGDAEKARNLLYNFTKKQLREWNVKYHRLVLGKPAGDVYIDDKGINDKDFFTD
jgi:capsule biosynthesis phosphatase